MQQQISFLDSLCGKTSPAPSVQTAEKTSEPSSKRSVPSAKTTLMFLDLRPGMGGNLLGAYWEMDTVLPGESTTLNTGECPKDVRESTLSQILQANAPEKYSLSRKACLGILRRAQKRGKQLPDMLRDALMEVVGSDGDIDDIDLSEDEDVEDEEFEDEEDFDENDDSE